MRLVQAGARIAAMNVAFPRRPAARLLSLLLLAAALPAHAELVPSDAWSRATVPGATTAVGYLVLTNTGSDERKLLKITSPACDTVALHRSSVDSEGRSRMWPVGSLQVRAGEAVRFEPNGLHVMFTGIKAAFKVGDKVPLVLTFEGDDRQISELTVQLEVRPLVPAPATGQTANPH